MEMAGSIVARLPEVQSVWASAGDLSTRGFADSPDAVRLWAHVTAPAADRSTLPGRDPLVAKVRDLLREVPGIVVRVNSLARHGEEGPAAGADIAVKLFHNDLGELHACAKKLHAKLLDLRGVVDGQVQPPTSSVPELRIEVDHRKAAALGLSIGDVTEVAQAAFQGRIVGAMVESGERHELIVTYDPRSRESPETVGKTRIANSKGDKVPLGTLVTISRVAAPQTIYREHGQRCAIVAWNVEGRKPGDVLQDAKRLFADVPLPKGCSLTWEMPGTPAR
jgi:Cu/Ag efflux pump CusA